MLLRAPVDGESIKTAGRVCLLNVGRCDLFNQWVDPKLPVPSARKYDLRSTNRANSDCDVIDTTNSRKSRCRQRRCNVWRGRGCNSSKHFNDGDVYCLAAFISVNSLD